MDRKDDMDLESLKNMLSDVPDTDEFDLDSIIAEVSGQAPARRQSQCLRQQRKSRSRRSPHRRQRLAESQRRLPNKKDKTKEGRRDRSRRTRVC
ncbi:MAG: hypothetical protein ACLT4C_03735 [Butyricicoccus sp.]